MRLNFRARFLVALGIVVAGFAAASPALAGSGHALRGKAGHGAATRTIHVTAELTTGDEVDLAPKGRSVGDEFVFSGRLLSAGAAGRPVGRIGGYCVLADLARNAGECTMTAVLPGGQISVQGEQVGIPTPAAVANAIVGGTGAFSRARGEVVQKFVTPPIRDLTFRLILRP